ncbi:MAG TPA: lipoyl domain-containing protein [Bryobacteraceae bacterium]|jgi:pyruvate/2-oxoglutarate dehydrogenase complex dihydrolipoamide acyltransferase (E2) component|nr:lipoyl domain-containing protein [Bryobacteraceae bacterium]
MSTEIILPQLGFGIEEGKLAEWLVADGTEVSEGDLIFSLETDKATQDIEAATSGRLRIGKEPGEVYPVGTVLGVLE